nr:glycosyltransferase family 39 protein [Lewinella sp. JB7]
MYASRLDWGYFDHPPAVALLVSLGMDWLPGPLGIRFGHVLAGTATVAALYHLLERPRGAELTLAAALIFAQPMLQVYGFIATPDGPLLLFTVLYLLAYRRFLARPDGWSGLWWGLTMAGLLYSKYHGIVLITFSVLPKLGWLLRQRGAWIAALSGLLLFLPHLYWQYTNDYPSFRYHLGGRDDPYQFKFTTEYILNQLLIFSPLLVYHYVKALWKDRAHDDFERACRWLIAGFMLFFLYTTTKGGTEAQWTALLSIPLVFLTFQAARRFPAWQGSLLRLCYLSGALLLVARLLIAAPRDWLPFDKPFDHAPWVERLAARAGDRPVIVENSYRLASLYTFYSGGRPAWTFTDVEYRPSQYDIWRGDTAFHDRPVVLLGQADWKTEGALPFRTQKRDMLLREIEHFQVAAHVSLFPSELPRSVLLPGRKYSIRLRALSPQAVDLRGELPLDLFAILWDADGGKRYWALAPVRINDLAAGEEVLLYDGPLHLPPDLPVGEGVLEFGLAYRGMPPLRGQSGSQSVTIGVRQ